MTLKEELIAELEVTRQNFHHLLDSVPEASYSQPSANPAWTIGDVLYHIALGVSLIHYEIWLTRYAGGVLQAGLKLFPSKLLNFINARLARQGNRNTRASLMKLHKAGHRGVLSDLERMKETDFKRSIYVPPRLEIILSENVSIERLFRHVKIHFETHEEQIRAANASRVIKNKSLV